MLVLGLVGGVASGKTAVADLFRELGAAVIRGDEAGHAALRETQVKAALRAHWGNAVFGPSGEIDRAAVARIVFASTVEGKEDLKWLEGVTHPFIKIQLERELALARAKGHVAAVLDAPILLEAGWGRLCDKIIFVDVPRDLRLARAQQRGWSAAEFDRREAAQWPVAEKRNQAHFVVDNSTTLEAARLAVKTAWRDWALPLPAPGHKS